MITVQELEAIDCPNYRSSDRYMWRLRKGKLNVYHQNGNVTHAEIKRGERITAVEDPGSEIWADIHQRGFDHKVNRQYQFIFWNTTEPIHLMIGKLIFITRYVRRDDGTFGYRPSTKKPASYRVNERPYGHWEILRAQYTAHAEGHRTILLLKRVA